MRHISGGAKVCCLGIFIKCHTEKQGATKLHIRDEARVASQMKILKITSQVSQDYYSYGFFQTVPSCLLCIAVKKLDTENWDFIQHPQ